MRFGYGRLLSWSWEAEDGRIGMVEKSRTTAGGASLEAAFRRQAATAELVCIAQPLCLFDPEITYKAQPEQEVTCSINS